MRSADPSTNAVGHALVSAARSGHLTIVDYFLNSIEQYKPNSEFVSQALDGACQYAEFEMMRQLIHVLLTKHPSSSGWSSKVLDRLISWCSIYPEAVHIVHELLNILPVTHQPDAESVGEALKQAIYENPSIAEAILRRNGASKPSTVAIGEALSLHS